MSNCCGFRRSGRDRNPETRLFNETQEALQQQTATAEVLKVISRSAFDLQTVLETLIHSAVELCAANRGAVFLRDGDVFRWRAATGSGDEYAAYMRAHPQSGGRGSTVGASFSRARSNASPTFSTTRSSCCRERAR